MFLHSEIYKKLSPTLACSSTHKPYFTRALTFGCSSPTTQSISQPKFKEIKIQQPKCDAPRKQHPYPSFYCDSMKEERKNEFLAFFQAQKSNVSCTNSSVVMEWNVPLLSSFSLSFKKNGGKMSPLFLRLFWKCPVTPLTHALEKCWPLLSSFSLSYKRMAAKFSPLFLRLSWKMPEDSSLSHTLEKMAAFALHSVFPTKEWRQNFPSLSSLRVGMILTCSIFFSLNLRKKNVFFYLWLWKKMRDSKKCRNLFSQCWWAPDWKKKSSMLTYTSLAFQLASVAKIENH